MIEQLWYGRHPLKYLLYPLLWPLSLVYGAVSARRRQKYQTGKSASYRAPVPVVVVGNITAGGNGKTPVVVWLVERLQQLGYRPGVVSRGYGARAPYYPLLVEPTTPATHCGDEPKLIAQRTGAPVAVSPVRSDAVKALLPLGVDIIITDDGLQHYALQRDIELSVMDGVRRYGNQALIPLGPLREPMCRLQEVDFIINNGGVAQAGEIAMTLAPSLAVNLHHEARVSVEQLPELVALAGIGHPPRFFATLETLGADLVATQGFADHRAYQASELKALAQQGLNVIMTEKDAVKCREWAEENWWYLPVDAQFSPQDELRILNRIKEVMEHYGSPSA